ncbi:MAG: hypothetical protein JNM66_08345 [Bryobacterales bacterium]|nr:hypothetical protein [Bryobacterales bacterium]
MLLLLTVGKNPLPVAVASAFLIHDIPSVTHVCLLHSGESQEEAHRIRDFLVTRNLRPGITVSCSPVENAAGGDSVFTVTSNLIAAFADVHCHYSGGTAYMAVESFRAILAQPRVRLHSSYLSASGNTLFETSPNSSGRNRTLSNTLTLTVPEMIALHGYQYCSTYDCRPIPQLTDILAPLAEEYEISSVPRIELNHRFDRVRAPIPFSVNLHTGDPILATRLNELLREKIWAPTPASTWQATISTGHPHYASLDHFFRGIGGIVELRVLSALRRATVGTKGEIVFAKHIARNANVTANTELQTFEIDIVAVFGYQLVLISCTTGKNDKTKLKAFEALHRARQLGGGAARAIFVAPTEQPGFAATYEDSLHLDIGFRPSPASPSPKPLEIWGPEKCAHLDAHLERYIAGLCPASPS